MAGEGKSISGSVLKMMVPMIFRELFHCDQQMKTIKMPTIGYIADIRTISRVAISYGYHLPQKGKREGAMLSETQVYWWSSLP
jgi:hypothetical protein